VQTHDHRRETDEEYGCSERAEPLDAAQDSGPAPMHERRHTHAPSAMIGNHVTLARIIASMLAVGFTIGGQIPVRASHAPATATTLLITLGGFPADLATIGVVVVGVGISTLFCDWGRRLVTGQFAFQKASGQHPIQEPTARRQPAAEPRRSCPISSISLYSFSWKSGLVSGYYFVIEIAAQARGGDFIIPPGYV